MPLAKNSLFPKDSPAEKRRIYSVSQITRDIKTILEEGFSGVWVEGEISNFKQATSGHYYFSLKDTGAIIGAAMFYRANREVKFKLEDGLKVVCFGRIDVYAPKGKRDCLIQRTKKSFPLCPGA
jgi:exodeoxyribonuclease VII large subunit